VERFNPGDCFQTTVFSTHICVDRIGKCNKKVPFLNANANAPASAVGRASFSLKL